MARTIAEIQAQMDNEQALQSGLSGLTSPSQVAIYTLWKYIMSSSIWAHETLWDIFKAELETIATNAQIGTTAWVQSQIFKFQYSATTPQIVQLVDFSPAYDPVDETLQIVTRCSVRTLPGRIVSIKVAKSEPPEALTSTELSSLTSYMNDISFAGVQYNITSTASDKLYLVAEIFYNGQYSTVISDNVIAAIEAYMSALPFPGVVYVSKLEDAIQAVTGVTDIVITDLAVRADATPWSSTTYIVLGKETIFRNYTTNSGYVVQETTSGKTFLDKLTFTPES